MKMLFVRVLRDMKSYQYKRNPKAKDDWHNNDNFPCGDDFILYEYESIIFQAKCQSIANIPGGKFLDSITTGPFLIRCFLEKRNFHCEVHGICQTATLNNDWIDDDCTTVNNDLRWLIHDDQKTLPNPAGQITRIPWSAGCIVLRKNDHEAFNTILRAYDYDSDSTIDAELLNKEREHGLH